MSEFRQKFEALNKFYTIDELITLMNPKKNLETAKQLIKLIYEYRGCVFDTENQEFAFICKFFTRKQIVYLFNTPEDLGFNENSLKPWVGHGKTHHRNMRPQTMELLKIKIGLLQQSES